jgi:hypothetical protein
VEAHQALHPLAQLGLVTRHEVLHLALPQRRPLLHVRQLAA